jgi:DNA-binding transcriptional LysR family regulator
LEPYSGDEFTAEVLFEDPFVVTVGRNSKWARRRNIRLADLVSERWVLPPLPAVLEVIHSAFDAAGVQRPTADVMSLSMHIHNSLLATGKFVSTLPRSTFAWDLDDQPFTVLPIDMPTTLGRVAIHTLRGRTLSPAAQLFTDSLRELAVKQGRNKRF